MTNYQRHKLKHKLMKLTVAVNLQVKTALIQQMRNRKQLLALRNLWQKIILQFFWSSLEGDFTWPVASFPLHKINAKTLPRCVWNLVNVLSGITFGNDNEKQVQVLYGVCDGATHSSAFFNQQGQTNWMVDNPYNNNKPIVWLSDPPHMIKKLRNFIISQNRHLFHQDFEISLSHLMEVAERGLTKLSYKHLFKHPEIRCL